MRGVGAFGASAPVSGCGAHALGVETREGPLTRPGSWNDRGVDPLILGGHRGTPRPLTRPDPPRRVGGPDYVASSPNIKGRLAGGAKKLMRHGHSRGADAPVGSNSAGVRSCAWCAAALPMGGQPVFKLGTSVPKRTYLCAYCYADAYTDDAETQASDESEASRYYSASDSEADYESVEAGSGDDGEDVHTDVHERRTRRKVSVDHGHRGSVDEPGK